MQSQPIFIILSVLVVAAFARDCSKLFKDNELQAKVSEDCAKSLNISEKDLPKDEKEFTANFDDKCYGKCFLTGMKFLVDDSKLDRDAMKKDIEEHVLDKEAKEKIIAYTMKCLDEAEKANGGKITKDNECKLAAQFMYCSTQEEGKLDLKCDPPADAPKPKN